MAELDETLRDITQYINAPKPPRISGEDDSLVTASRMLQRLISRLAAADEHTLITASDAVDIIYQGDDIPSFRRDVQNEYLTEDSETITEPADEAPMSISVVVAPTSHGMFASHSIQIVTVDHESGKMAVLRIMPGMMANFMDAIIDAQHQIIANCDALCGGIHYLDDVQPDA